MKTRTYRSKQRERGSGERKRGRNHKSCAWLTERGEERKEQVRERERESVVTSVRVEATEGKVGRLSGSSAQQACSRAV